MTHSQSNGYPYVKWITTNGFLYSFWTGQLKIYRGIVYAANKETATASFKTDTGKRFLCSSKESEVYNSVVWLKEHNAKLALEKLIDFKNRQISETWDKLENLRANKRVIEEHLKGENE